MTVSLSSSVPSDSTAGPPPIDPEAAAGLARMAGMPPLTPEAIPIMRAGMTKMAPTDTDLSRGGAFTIEQRTVPGPEGAPALPLLICRPVRAKGPTAAMYYIHGGGYVLGNARTELPGMLDIAEELNVSVVSVEYRLAPETPHPGPVLDCFAGLEWITANAEELRIQLPKVVVAGGSAGGGLAAAVALMARDRSGPALAGQLLMSPALDDRDDTVSAQQMSMMWEKAVADVGWSALLGSDRRGLDLFAYGSAARADDLSDLPPTFIDVGSVEVLRDQSVTYANRIWQAGGAAELHVWPGAYHGFDLFAPQSRIAQDARQARLRWLRRILAS